ncbi:response regulator transcription factor [Marinoscillum furvescens]|uniref:DNA-binding response OmpR family regulator n=1 Tax=Marinoscillum furvescens DSM 4134 TaxID=1122208 RepID=A0A3D9L2H8_MARFU|nr:response regulator transcription factor [Marinoscillum furvescens]RED98815.1 DNA-binding response OmpR family regulator [Marinoscillum furvescens DSM 4134]
MEKPRLLIAEDDENLGQILNEYLNLKGYTTTLCRDGEEGAAAFKPGKFDLCILDLMMPKKDGFQLATEIKEIDADIPIIFLTAKSMKEDVIKGFKIGADDYITKPFSMEVLLMRIQAVLHRTMKGASRQELPEELVIGKLKYQHANNSLELPSGPVRLTTKENELLKLFFENLNQTVTRTIALKKIWKDDSYFNARSMDVYIAKLRKYLREEESLKLLTVHGEGFKLVQMN